MNTSLLGPREILGRIVGALWAGPVALVSAARHARTFHPRGVLYRARLDPVETDPASEMHARFSGHALVRLSGALSKYDAERNEVLGLAMRISDRPITSVEPRDGDQDLLFATIVSPVTMPIAPYLTRSDDFLENRYWAVAPFRMGEERVKLRLTPAVRAHDGAGTRREKLTHAARSHRAVLYVEVRRTLTVPWLAVATLTLEEPIDLDQEALRFDPFRTGRGIEPVGFVHAIRKAVYAASQRARPAHG